jgi:hypothetical protein
MEGHLLALGGHQRAGHPGVLIQKPGRLHPALLSGGQQLVIAQLLTG